jgi:hypothetical protein
MAEKYKLSAEHEALLEGLDVTPQDPELTAKKIQLIRDYFSVIILERQINMAQTTSLPTYVKYNISMPTEQTLAGLNDIEIESLLDRFADYEKLKKTNKDFNSDPHNVIALQINNIVTRKLGGKRTRRKKQKRRTKKLKRRS